MKVLATTPEFNQELEIEGPPKIKSYWETWWRPIPCSSDLTKLLERQRGLVGDWLSSTASYKFTMENEDHLFEGCYIIECRMDGGGGLIRTDNWQPKRRV